MAILKIKNTAGEWVDIAGVGPQGPPGGPVPVGGQPGDVIVKTGAADGEVGWTVQRPRCVARALVGTINSHATASTMGNLVTVSVDIDPTRLYHIFASVRAVQDPGGLMPFAQYKVAVGTAQMEGYDCVSGPDSGLWGAWSQTWVKDGTAISATPVTVNATLDLNLNAASKTVYAPRLYIFEY
jgi:hypothetical protein